MNIEQQVRFNFVMKWLDLHHKFPDFREIEQAAKYVAYGPANAIVPAMSIIPVGTAQ